LDPHVLGKKYDKIAGWWQDHHRSSDYGLTQIDRAISYCKSRKTALDVGCGAGGRIIHRLLNDGFNVTGVDVSEKMIALAKSQHPEAEFHVGNIIEWQVSGTYDLIVAWDSIFHLPLLAQVPVVSKLCQLLEKSGVLVYTFGDDCGEHESSWHNDKFYYSSVGITENLKIIMANGCECRHLELDQYPERHVSLIVKKK